MKCGLSVQLDDATVFCGNPANQVIDDMPVCEEHRHWLDDPKEAAPPTYSERFVGIIKQVAADLNLELIHSKQGYFFHMPAGDPRPMYAMGKPIGDRIAELERMA